MSDECLTSLYDKILEHIMHNRNVEAKAMLNQKLARSYNAFGTLLHHAAMCRNDVIAQELVRLGAKIDSLEHDNKTPLNLAIEFGSIEIVKVLLEANASIDVIAPESKSALQVALDMENYEPNIVQAFGNKLKSQNCTTEKLAERLIAAGCNMHHAAVLSDISLMKCMLDRGIEIDSEGSNEKTALHVAAELSKLDLVKWLLKNGAEVNALDENENSALAISSTYGNKDIMKILLEQGANPNSRNLTHQSTPLFILFSSPNVDEKEFANCVELLLEHGAIPQNLPYDDSTLFDYALYAEDDEIIRILISHLAILEFTGIPNTRSVIHCYDQHNESQMFEYKEFYDLCLDILDTAVFEELSLFDLLEASESRMRVLVRNQTFVSEVKNFCSEQDLGDLYSYYHKKIMKLITTASRLTKLEDEAIPVISKIFNHNRDLCYYCAREIVSYLDERDLENLLLI